MRGLFLVIEPPIVLIARLYLGLFFLSSALGKLTHQRTFVQGTLEYRLLPESAARFVAYMLPWIELVLALALLGGWFLPYAGLVVTSLLLCFIGAVLVNLRRGRTIRCHCYGLAGTTFISWGTIARNVLLLLLALVIILGAPGAATLEQWRELWRVDLSLLSSLANVILLLFLITFCTVMTHLCEWSVDLAMRRMRLTMHGKAKQRKAGI